MSASSLAPPERPLTTDLSPFPLSLRPPSRPQAAPGARRHPRLVPLRLCRRQSLSSAQHSFSHHTLTLSSIALAYGQVGLAASAAVLSVRKMELRRRKAVGSLVASAWKIDAGGEEGTWGRREGMRWC